MKFNTIEGIQTYLDRGLEGLNELVQDRHRYGYQDGNTGRLHQFIIMGRWATDTCGNFGPLTILDDHWKPKPVPERIPDVIRTEDCEKYGFRHYSVDGRNNLPRADIQCSGCKRQWKLENAHDSHMESTQTRESLSEWEAKTLREFDEFVRKRTDAHYFLGSDPSIRNDKFIDLSPNPDAPSKPLNERGWSRDRYNLDYVIQTGDETSAWVFRYWHTQCWEISKCLKNREQFQRIFQEAGFRSVYLRDIPNGYEGDNIYTSPWFIAKTQLGDIQIGWRRHVINIDWSTTKRDLSHLFEEAKVTKGPMMIHAWGEEMAINFLRRIREGLGA